MTYRSLPLPVPLTLPRLAALTLVAAAAAFSAGTAHAQFKVVGPDGKVTYTDRPPPAADGKVVPMGPGGAKEATAKPEAALPFALREVAGRFPVTLYAMPECPPCDSGRSFLRQRGIPFQEKFAGTDADRAAWQRVVGSREAPGLAVGGQLLSGFTPEGWNEVLDTAGYPRESKLPSNYTPPAPTPLVAAQKPVAAPPAAQPTAPEAPFTPASGIRF